jgi:uncharacterized RDD family membrane protein YckC
MHTINQPDIIDIAPAATKMNGFDTLPNKRMNIIKRFRNKLNSPPELHVKYATLGNRIIAVFVDIIVIFTLLSLMNEVFKIYIPTYTSGKIPDIVIAIFAWFFYNTVLEGSFFKATVGMMVLKIKVVDLKGKRISFLRALGRNFSTIFSILPLGIGLWYATTDSRKRCWHDLIAGTYVVKI